MKQLFSLAAAALLALGAQAQTTFNVDMTCAPEGFTDVFVTGPWCGWCANDTYNTMTDLDGDGVTSMTEYLELYELHHSGADQREA